MKKTIHSAMIACFVCNGSANAQELKYIDERAPVVETSSPSRDGQNTYHFYYSFNWIADSSIFDKSMKPKIDRIEFYRFGATEPFRTVESFKPENPSTQVEFKVKRADFGDNNQIQYAVRWEIENASNQRIVNETPRKSLRINFDNDPVLSLEVLAEGLYYTDDMKHPRIKIKSSHDGTAIEQLVLRTRKDENSDIIAEVTDNITRINANGFTELTFNLIDTSVNLTEGKSYYLYGKFKNTVVEELKGFVPITRQNNEYPLKRKERYFIKPMANSNTSISVTGHQSSTVILDAHGDLKYVKATINLGSRGTRIYPLRSLGDQRWELTIPKDVDIPFGTYNLDFEGIGLNGEPIQKTTFSYIKNKVARNIFQLEFEGDTYTATAEFNSVPSGRVYLDIDGTHIEMNNSTSNSKTYSVTFSLKDKNIQKIAENIKQAGGKKRILLTTQVDDITDEQQIAKNAVVIDTKELEGKKNKDIVKYLEDMGFKENVDELAKSISNELKKNKSDRDWDSNVWTLVVEWAPKVIPLVLMLI